MDALPTATPLGGAEADPGHCPACAGRALRPVFRQPSVPANSCLMLDTAAEARAFPRGAMDLVFCEACGLVFNAAFDARLTEYSDRYEPTQAHSATFRRFHQDLALRLVAATGLDGGTVVEVGCGQGEFLHLLCRGGRAHGIGFDPCLDPARGAVVGDRAAEVTLHPRFFDAEAARDLHADLLVCKMTLEHIPAAGRFAALAAQVARNSAPGMRLFVQVPDCERIFAEGAFEDVYYEHCSYFTAAPLVALFARHGFAAEAVTREYGGQYLTLLARHTGEPGEGVPAAELARLGALLDGFAGTLAARIAHWRDLVARRAAEGLRVVLWGSGSKGVSFLGAIGGGDGVSHVVDVNPHRQGRFMVGTGHPIIGPDELPALAPATVILMNRVYREEVAAALAARGLSPELLAL